jgi:phytoene dehydrogenase-like protein
VLLDLGARTAGKGVFQLADNVVIVGGGMAGLTCAWHLQQAEVPFTLLEASDRCGGRVQTDEVNGFRCDRGFQILLTSYPEASAVLDYGKLDLHAFYPGALVHFDGDFHRMADPFRRPVDAMTHVFSPIGSTTDKARVLGLRRQARAGTLEDVFTRPQTTTINRLSQLGFSPGMVDRFLRPFLAGVFLENQLDTSSRKLEFVFRMFSLGSNTLPAGGIAAIPNQIVDRLPASRLRLNSPVEAIDHGQVRLVHGETIAAKAIVVATEAGPLAHAVCRNGPVEYHRVSCIYYAADRPPIAEPILILNGDGSGPINNLCFPSEVAPGYAPKGQTLVSVSILDRGDESNEQLEAAVRKQLVEWFGQETETWEHLRTYRIPLALPAQPPDSLNTVQKPVRIDRGLYVCGDHRDMASLNGAMASGRKVAEAVYNDLFV